FPFCSVRLTASVSVAADRVGVSIIRRCCCCCCCCCFFVRPSGCGQGLEHSTTRDTTHTAQTPYLHNPRAPLPLSPPLPPSSPFHAGGLPFRWKKGLSRSTDLSAGDRRWVSSTPLSSCILARFLFVPLLLLEQTKLKIKYIALIRRCRVRGGVCLTCRL